MSCLCHPFSNSGLRGEFAEASACYFTEPPAGARTWQTIMRATGLLSSSCYSEQTEWVSVSTAKAISEAAIFALKAVTVHHDFKRKKHMLQDTDLQSCIDECTRCHAICLRTMQYCLQKSARYAGANHVRLLQDCTEICLASANFMLRGSEFYPNTCGVCAEICDRCARSCEKIGGGQDEHMNECSQTCRRCAQSCHEMSVSGRLVA